MGLFQGWAVLASGWLCREEVFWDRARGGDGAAEPGTERGFREQALGWRGRGGSLCWQLVQVLGYQQVPPVRTAQAGAVVTAGQRDGQCWWLLEWGRL